MATLFLAITALVVALLAMLGVWALAREVTTLHTALREVVGAEKRPNVEHDPYRTLSDP